MTMPIITRWDLSIDANDVLRGQGAEPAAISLRNPHLVELAAQALEEGRPLLRPRVSYRRLDVEGLTVE